MDRIAEMKQAIRRRASALSMAEAAEVKAYSDVLKLIIEDAPNHDETVGVITHVFNILFDGHVSPNHLAVAVVTAFPRAYLSQRKVGKAWLHFFSGIRVVGLEPVVKAASLVREPTNKFQARARWFFLCDWSQYPPIHREAWGMLAIQGMSRIEVAQTLRVERCEIENLWSLHNLIGANRLQQRVKNET